jgi:cysteinyl-tRNA synthetase
MSVRIYNTLTHKKEIMETLEPGMVKMYVCGPTVYNKAHVGHAMSAVVFDIIKRYLTYRGYQVRHLMNFTDVDDKIINRANQMGRDPFELANGYIDDFQKNLKDLNVLPATFNPRATQTIPQIINMVQGLVEKGYAYPVETDELHNADVYFRVTKDDDYGRLSGRKLDDMQAGARIEVDDRKEHPMDFALWKAAKPGEPYWDSPWGKGRPGWHIECSAMNLEHMGEQIDIHGGGNDLVFPHHENEIAQSESLTGKTFSHYWVHNGMLQMSGEKMSKSLGNMILIEDFLAQHSADVLRLMVLNSGYRNPLTFNDEVIDQTKRALERLHSALRPAQPNAGGANEIALQGLKTQMDTTRTGFTDSMDDDFNSAGALGYIFDMVRVINQSRSDGAKAGEIEPAQALLRELTGVLGLRLEKTEGGGQAANPFIDLLIELRTQMRTQKQYAFSDQIRDRLLNLGVVLEDSKDGTTWRWQ